MQKLKIAGYIIKPSKGVLTITDLQNLMASIIFPNEKINKKFLEILGNEINKAERVFCDDEAYITPLIQIAQELIDWCIDQLIKQENRLPEQKIEIKDNLSVLFDNLENLQFEYHTTEKADKNLEEYDKMNKHIVNQCLAENNLNIKSGYEELLMYKRTIYLFLEFSQAINQQSNEESCLEKAFFQKLNNHIQKITFFEQTQ